MLGFFRRIVHSRVGVIVTFGVLIVIALAFAAGDITGLRTGGGGLTGGEVATVGRSGVTAAEFRTRAQNEMEGYRQQQPTLTMAQFVQGGGLEGTLERLMTALSFEQFAAKEGMVVSKAAVDGQIAAIPGLQGPTGKFDPRIYQRLLAERHLTDASIRGDIARETLSLQLIVPTQGASQVSTQLALPYASLLLERRQGDFGFVPLTAFRAGPAPTDAEVAQFYQRGIARYTVPPRRVIRYALVTADQVRAEAAPTDAEIAQAYRDAGARFAATEKRTIAQVVVADQAGAAAIAARVKGGASIADAARAAGLEGTQIALDRAAYTAANAPAVATAVFAAARGSVVGPVRGPLGWVVARVEDIQQVAGKSLDQARADLVAQLTRQKTAAALGDIRDGIDDALSRNATFDEVVAERKLAGRTTPAVLPNGGNPDDPAARPDAALAPVIAAGFAEQEGDPPQMVPIGADGGFALVGVGRVIPAASQPLAKVRETVMRDLALDRARKAARRVAGDIVAKANKGGTLAQALTGAGVALPPARPLTASRAQLAVNPQGAPPPLALLFSMTQGTAKLLEAPDNAGWYVVKLNRIEPGNAAGKPRVVTATRSDLSKVVGREYVEQFIRAVRADVGTRKNDAAIATVRADLLGSGGSDN